MMATSLAVVRLQKGWQEEQNNFSPDRFVIWVMSSECGQVSADSGS